MTVGILTFSSCSEAKYSFRKKVKVEHPVATVIEKHSTAPAPQDEAVKEKTVTAEEASAAGPADASIEASAAAAPMVFPVKYENESPRPAAATDVKATAKQKATERMLNKLYKKEFRSEKASPDSVQFISSMGGRWIIAGLILILVGAIVGIFAQPFGWIISTVGGVILIIGLIFLLLELL